MRFDPGIGPLDAAFLIAYGTMKAIPEAMEGRAMGLSGDGHDGLLLKWTAML